MIFFLTLTGASVCMCDMQNAFDGIVESGQEKRVEEAFYGVLLHE